MKVAEPSVEMRVRTATEDEEASVIDVVALAFTTDPAARWSWRDPHKYLTYFPRFVKAFGGKAFAHGSAYTVDAYSGAALWLPPDVEPDEEEMTALLESSVPEETLNDVAGVLEQMGRFHPNEPHWYLPLMGVDPMQQGRGIGSALMQYALIACDRDRKLAYLESTNPRNIPLYERHGFELLGTIQVGTSPTLFPMLRKPR